MAAEYAQGNYALAGGDFNKDLPGDSGADYAWAQPFPTELLPEGITLYAPENARTSRYACEPYDPATAVTITLDGFLASENIEVLSCEAIEEGFPTTTEILVDHERRPPDGKMNCAARGEAGMPTREARPWPEELSDVDIDVPIEALFHPGMSDEEKLDIAAARVFKRWRGAFEELAK